MTKRALRVDEKDNVAVVLEDVEASDWVEVDGYGRLMAAERIPFSHKISLTRIGKGQPVIRYGERIGVASRDIREGEWVHIHNLEVPENLLDM